MSCNINEPHGNKIIKYQWDVCQFTYCPTKTGLCWSSLLPFPIWHFSLHPHAYKSPSTVTAYPVYFPPITYKHMVRIFILKSSSLTILKFPWSKTRTGSEVLSIPPLPKAPCCTLPVAKICTLYPHRVTRIYDYIYFVIRWNKVRCEKSTADKYVYRFLI